MKKDWTYKTLGEVCVAFLRGLTYSKSDEVPTSSNKVLRSNNIDLSSHKLNFDEIKCIREDFVIPDDKKLKEGSIFICMSNGSMQHLGKVAYVDKDYDFAYGGFMGLIVPDKNIVVPKFVYYSLLAPRFLTTILREGRGANINNLKFSDLDAYLIPLHPLAIQRSIVAELDLLHSVIEKKQEQLRALDNLAQSLFYQMFGDPITNPMGWEKVPISVHVADKKTIKRASKRFAGSDEIEYIDISSINNQSHVITDTTNYIFNEAPSRAQQCVAYGDILISLVRPNLKNIAVVCDNRGNLVASSGFCVLRVKETACLLFLKQILLSDYFTQYLLTRVSGANYPAVHESDILDYQIITPPLSLQQSFAAKVSAIEAQKQFISQSIKDVESLLAQRMDHYFG